MNNQKKIKVVAYYLPQYHDIAENNEWWGDGFTEWTHVRAAKPLYKGHVQPKKPLNNNYYNLLDRNTIQWQTNLAKENGIDVFAYYHYWFNGRLIMEKPLENYLDLKEIRHEFMIVWANHTWYKNENGKRRLLIEQTYGQKEDWLNHFNYCLRFFKDERYLKINNKPVVQIYDPLAIDSYNEMIEFWNQLARDNGFGGLYIIDNITSFKDDVSKIEGQAVVLRQPGLAISQYRDVWKGYLFPFLFYGLSRKLGLKCFEKLNYKKISYLEQNINTKYFSVGEKKVYYCVSTGWDNSPRHQYRGKGFYKFDLELFKNDFKVLYQKSIDEGNEILFVNAWNEWAEGMVLEPSEEYQNGLLEKIKEVTSA